MERSGQWSVDHVIALGVLKIHNYEVLNRILKAVWVYCNYLEQSVKLHAPHYDEA